MPTGALHIFNQSFVRISSIEIHAISSTISAPRIKVTTHFFRIGFSGSESTGNFSNPIDLTVF